MKVPNAVDDKVMKEANALALDVMRAARAYLRGDTTNKSMTARGQAACAAISGTARMLEIPIKRAHLQLMIEDNAPNARRPRRLTKGDMKDVTPISAPCKS